MTLQMPFPASNRAVILASTSRYRQELLSRLRIPFDIAAPHVDETPRPGEASPVLAQRLALAKAQAVAARFPSAVVIGSDQVADLNSQSLGKPGTHAIAVLQLKQMRGQTVWFHTAVAVLCQATGFQQRAMVDVKATFRDLSDDEIENYLQLEKPYDCAGSAKSEGLGIVLMHAITSDDPTALIGLPLIKTCHMLHAAGIALLPKKDCV